jgi:acyl carrier protein
VTETIDQRSNARRILNLYGPSEDTIFSSMAVLQPGSKRPPTIGRPIANKRFYVLDRELRPVPTGAVGQLYIAGGGVTRGYVGRPDLSAERFLPDPIGVARGARMYRTGDYVRQRANGELEYRGRVDRQIKIRGFRVELGEIEAVLQGSPGVMQAAVIARTDDPQLVAYLVVEPAGGPGHHSIDASVRSQLPAHMVPGAYVFLDTLPALPNGKVDRSALARIGPPAPAVSAECRLPRTDLEERILDVLQTTLNRPRAGIHDHLFTDLGAHSLVIIQLAARLRERLGLPVSVIELFQFPTVASLAARLTARDTRQPSGPLAEHAGRQRQDAVSRRRQFRRAAQAEGVDRHR